MSENRNFYITMRSYSNFIQKFLKYADTSAPRGIPTHEIFGFNGYISNPIDRLVTQTSRKMHLPFAMAEFFSYMYGIEDIKFFTPFIESYTRFSTDGETLDGAYGTRIEMISGQNQFGQMIETLSEDKHSRQAIIQIYDRYDPFGRGLSNTPCTLSLQFLIRNNKLNLVTTMRSNDIWLGAVYDIFSFTLMQELATSILSRVYDGLSLGSYYHNVGSMHLYDSDIPKLKDLKRSARWNHLMPAMPYINMDTFHNMKPYFTEAVFEKSSELPRKIFNSSMSYDYWKEYFYTMKAYLNKNEPSVVRTCMLNIEDPTIKRIVRAKLGIKNVIR